MAKSNASGQSRRAIMFGRKREGSDRKLSMCFNVMALSRRALYLWHADALKRAALSESKTLDFEVGQPIHRCATSRLREQDAREYPQNAP